MPIIEVLEIISYTLLFRWGFCEDSNELPIETGEHIRHRYYTVETTVLSEKYVIILYI